LLPGDIDIVIGVGDSLTAAFGADATSFFNLFTDYRATSFSAGFSRPIEEVSTLPGILRVFNPSVTGFSVGSGDETSASSNLNVAVSGADAYGLAYQVDLLVSKLQNYDRSGWKLISLFIGGNDLCDACAEKERFSTANFKANVIAALDTIKAQIPNVFVSLILPPDVTILAELSTGLCAILKPFECTCYNDPYTSPLHKEYVEALHEIERDPRYSDQANFYLVVQPFLELIRIPRLPNGNPDLSYFAPDCFHFSAKSHSAAGLSLWNNLLEPANEKKRDWYIGEPFECPVENQYLQ
jgi:phospholipase B1